jgi:hypothetical protein
MYCDRCDCVDRYQHFRGTLLPLPLCYKWSYTTISFRFCCVMKLGNRCSFLISDFPHVLNVICFLLGCYPVYGV